MRSLLLCAVALTWYQSSAVYAGCCSHCGCNDDSCCKVCCLVPEVKKVTKPVYDCECEDFCVPGKSDCCIGCDECGRRKLIYTPTCGCVRTRVKLIKKNETKEVKTFKCVVVDMCAKCAQQCDAQPVQTASAATPEENNESWATRALRNLPLSKGKSPEEEPSEPAPTAAVQPIAPEVPAEGARPANPLARVLSPLTKRK
jgi:hypothetical protein